MSMALVAFAVPADLATQVVGSRSRAVLNRLLRSSDVSSTNDYIRQQVEAGNWDPDSPPLGAVVKDIVHGRPVDSRWGFQWAAAVEMICSELGHRLTNDGFSPLHMNRGTELDAALKQAGIGAAFSFRQLLLNRGLVLPEPAGADTGIAAGFLRLAEIGRARRAFDRGRFSGLHEADRFSLGIIRGWFAVCETLDWELATFFS